MKKKCPGPYYQFLDCSLQFRIGRMNVIGKDNTRNMAFIRTRYNVGGYKKRGRCNFRPPVHFKMKIRSGGTQPGRLLSIH